jgi:hypothetical protein
MPEGWMAVDEACRYLGLDPWDLKSEDRLEELVVKYDVDVEVDDRGNLLELEPEDLKRVLFSEHERRVGYQPDDEDAVLGAVVSHDRRRRHAKLTRVERRERLRRRVSKRLGGDVT